MLVETVDPGGMAGHYGIREALLKRHGITLGDVPAISRDVEEARLMRLGSIKRRRLARKQKEPGA